VTLFPLAQWFIAFVVATVVGWMGTGGVARLGERFRLFDRDEGRNLVGYRAIPRIGGMSLVVAMVAGCLSGAAALRNLPWHTLLGGGSIWIAAAAMFVVGLLDDIRSVPARLKLLALIGAGTLVTVGGFRLQRVPLLHWPLGSFSSFPFTILCFTAIATAWNFIDGLDGLAAGFTVLVALTCSLDGGFASDGLMVAPAVAGAALGFLAHNRPPAKIFMGDSGSLFLGFWIAFLCLVPDVQRSHHPASFSRLLVLAWPLADMAWALLRRVRRHALFSASGDHFHYLLSARIGHRQTVLVLLVVMSLLATSLIVFGSPWRSAGHAMAVAAVAICLFSARVRTQPIVVAIFVGLLVYMPTTLADSSLPTQKRVATPSLIGEMRAWLPASATRDAIAVDRNRCDRCPPRVLRP
jgi:UDP-GlcNAc:undecaprenyl-phosphate GlcNAc-1-phosphate transferase